MMKNFKKLILAFAGIAMGFLSAYSQTEKEIEDLLTRYVEVENPVYMPVIGVGTGYFNFYGNVNDAFRSYTLGKPAIRVNAAAFLGKNNRYFRGNLVFMMGELSGTQRSVADTSWYKNMNFKSNIISFGVNLHYSFKPWIKGKFFEPFISVGVETLQFDTKSDFLDAQGSRKYHFWPDGTIRDADGNIINRDYAYGTNLRSLNRNGLGKYSQFTIAIPVDIGIDFNVSSRITLRAATSLHYTFTDLIDDMSSKSNNPDFPYYKGKSSINMFTFSYLSLHLDLFSPPKVKKVEDLIANVEGLDLELMYSDQDNDGVFDWWDECPDTPEGVEVDEKGCPFDTDGDGVPDYLDREPNSRPGAIVDEFGVEINENMVVEILNLGALHRSDVETYLLARRAQDRARRGETPPMPDKFKKVDTNGDGYISFDELLSAINDYFDGSSGYSPGDIKELNEFFFEQ